MAEIIPTVMPSDQADFIEKIERVYRFVKTIQIDVMDGKFVPSKSWPYNSLPDNYWNELVAQNEGLPHWQDLEFEIDLMTTNQIGEAENWINAGVGRIIGHLEAFLIAGDKSGNTKGSEDNKSDDVKVAENFDTEKIAEFIKLGRDRGVEVCLALAPSTPNSALDKWLPQIDGVQFMGIEKVGYQGQPFAEEILEKIANLRAKITQLKKDNAEFFEKFSQNDFPIAVDGGVSDETAPALIKAGATRLSSGSYIFNATNPKEAIERLRV